MKYFHIKPMLFKVLLLGGVALTSTSCELNQLEDPNSPGINIIENPSASELQSLISGTEANMRNRLGTYLDGVAVIGRDYWRFSSSDPRFTSDLLGEGSSTLDNNTFYTTGPYIECYRTVKNANLLIEAVNNTVLDEFSAADKNDMIGFAKTIQAYQLLLVLNMQYENGIRTDVANPDNLGGFRSYTEALSDITSLLDEAHSNLSGSTTLFPFILSEGFGPREEDNIKSFHTSEAFKKFNRALAARVAVYQGDYSSALSKINNSFFDLNGELGLGVNYYFSTAGGDAINPLFIPLNNAGEIRAAHPSFISDAETGDMRLNKAVERTEATSLGTSGLTANHDVWVYPTNETPIPIIRNEELVLIYAEANIQTNNLDEGVKALNVIRNAAGLANYSGEVTQEALITEMLHQRRYSLFAEGHRWVDMRRYDRLGELPIDRENAEDGDDDVWVQFPRPANEG